MKITKWTVLSIVFLYATAVALWLFNVVSFAYTLRVTVVILPTLFYRRTSKSYIGTILCAACLSIGRVCVFVYFKFFASVDLISNISVKYARTSGIVDMIIVYGFFILVSVVSMKRMARALAKCADSNGVANKKRNVYINYLYTCMMSVLLFLITGIWDYGLKEYWYYVALAAFNYTIIYNRVASMYDRVYATRYLNVSQEE